MFAIALKPHTKGQVAATSSDGHTFLTTTPLLSGARYWLKQGINPETTIITVWSSGSTEWTLRSTIGAAAKLTVQDSQREGPRFRTWSAFPTGALTDGVKSADPTQLAPSSV
jgi:hypothetical protein